MKNFLKHILTLTVAISICAVFATSAYAVQPRYINDITGSNELTISNGKATMYSEVAGSSDITKVVITHVLQKKNGSSYTDVPNTKATATFYNNSAPDMETVVTCKESGTYRVKTNYVVTSPRGTDDHTQYSNTVTI